MFCRCPLRKDGHELKRGQSGIVKKVFSAHDHVDLQGHYLCRFNDQQHQQRDCVLPGLWLEQYPGTFSLGFNKLLESPSGLFWFGPLVSDLEFPEPHMQAYQRYNDHCRRLMTSGFGFSFYDGIDALAISESMLARYGRAHHRNLDPDHLGLIICEHPWTKGDGDRWSFLTALARSFLGQFSTIPKILEMRVSDWQVVCRHLTANNQELPRRIQVLRADQNEYQTHYTPLRHDLTTNVPDEIHASQCAIIFHPIARRFQFSQPLHVPECVLKEMFRNRRTLFVAAGTCESQIECLNYFLRQLRVNNITPPSTSYSRSFSLQAVS